jgi:hypothetical protein
VPIPSNGKCEHQSSKVLWNPNGVSFCALDKNQLVFVFPQEQFFDQYSEVGSQNDSRIRESQQTHSDMESEGQGTLRM